MDEAATRLKVHAETIRRWIRTGAMRGNLIGGDRAGYGVPASEVELRLRGLRPQLPDWPVEFDRKPPKGSWE